jgi:hypothetical protein
MARKTRSTTAKKASECGTREIKGERLRQVKNSRIIRSSQQDRRGRSAEEEQEACPNDFSVIDFHQTYGSFLTRRNPISQDVDPDIAKYWNMLSTTPAMLQLRAQDVGDHYRAAFKHFFNLDPISLHGHVSDAANPFLLTSLLMHLTAHSAEDSDFYFLSEDDRVAPRIATTDASYGGGYGPLAYNASVPLIRPVACGARPFVINTRIPARIDDQVRLAKKGGCVVLVAEIVRAADGTVISAAGWKALLRSCERHCLVLVVDEALTAIRCGAPFAHQLPQYRESGLPDLVLFGKAVRTNGIAIEWQGINIRKLAITDEDTRSFIIASWQERYTEMAPLADLLISTGTLTLAKMEDWPGRARKIGVILRDIIGDEGFARPRAIGGLHSLIYLRRRDYVRTSSPVMGAHNGKFIRWLPVMDEVMMSKDELKTKVFGRGSLAHRRRVAKWFASMALQPRWCARCGEGAGIEKRRLCLRCVANRCEDCEPGVHICPMEGFEV